MNKNEQAIRAMKTLKSNYSTANYSILRTELDLAIQALKNEQRRKEYLNYLKENIDHPDMKTQPYITQHKINALEECEVSDE